MAGLSVFFFALGWLGIWVPGLPTTVFWIASCWLASKSCPVIQRWVYARGRIGRTVKMIVEDRMLTAAGKRRALIGMASGLTLSVVMIWLLQEPHPLLIVGIIAAGVTGAVCILFGLRTCPASMYAE